MKTQPIASTRQKREQFHRQIRRKSRQQFFRSQRSLLHSISQQLQSSPSQSLQQLLSYENPSFIQINLSIQNNLPLSFDIQTKIINLFMIQDNLRNQHAMVCLISLINRQDIAKELLGRNFVRNVLQYLIQANVFKANNKIVVNYFNTLAWTMYSLALLTQDTSLFQDHAQAISMMEEFAQQDLTPNYQFICLASYLSKNSKLLPSARMINRLLYTQSLFDNLKNQRLIYSVINLLDNYLRFSKQQSVQIIHDYLHFIERRLKQSQFPPTLKQQLISLFTSIIRSSSQQMLSRLFSLQSTRSITNQVFYRAQYMAGKTREDSLVCFCEIVADLNLKNLVSFIDAESICQMLVTQLLYPKPDIITIVLGALIKIIQQGDFYRQYVRNSEINNIFKNAKFIQIAQHTIIINSLRQLIVRQIYQQ